MIVKFMFPMTKKLRVAFLGCQLLMLGCLSAEENILSNGNFERERQTVDWEGMKYAVEGTGADGFVTAPEMVEWVDEGYDGSQGALKATIAFQPDFVYKANQAGVRTLLKRPVPKGTNIRLKFAAKSVEGSPYLFVTRFTGGGAIDAPIELSKEWKEYDVVIPLSEDGTLLVFNLVGSEHALDSLQGPSPVTPDLAEGVFLIDQVTVTEEN